MFEFYKSLGFNSPYFFNQSGKIIVEKSFSSIVKKYGANLNIDPLAAIEILNKNYALADRTISKEIKKTPWQAVPNLTFTNWDFNDIPKHSKINLQEPETALILFEKLKKEIKIYISNRKKIGVLLSGGMDSRMVAGVLDYINKVEGFDYLEITGLTWGNHDSRDVIYAKRICERLGWKWKHYQVKASDFLNNIYETAIHGCEYSPLHLHALPQIRDDNQWEVILGGSYGDSIGRAEYSSKDLQNVKPLIDGMHNIGSIINSKDYEKFSKSIINDLDYYHKIYPRKEVYMQNELDYQIHYMRRMLNPCMELLNENSDFFQVFTHPETFGFMWSLNLESRSDKVYGELMSHFKTDLSDIPWARTGLLYGQKDGKRDNFKNRHHNYVEIIQKEILADIVLLLNSKKFKKIQIFNHTAISELLSLVKHKPYNSMYYLEQLTWLASLSKMLDIYDFNLDNKSFENEKTSLTINMVRKEYLPKYYRNIIGGYLRKLKIIK